ARHAGTICPADSTGAGAASGALPPLQARETGNPCRRAQHWPSDATEPTGCLFLRRACHQRCSRTDTVDLESLRGIAVGGRASRWLLLAADQCVGLDTGRTL